jgi:hypothetical protein
VPIISQNENGPCPLISICNVLFLRQEFKLNSNVEVISNIELIELLADSFLNHNLLILKQRADFNSSHIEIILNDSLRVMEKLQYGLDVNVRFNSCTNFVYTSELDIFDLFSINLYHGWLIDPQENEVYKRLGGKTHYQVVESTISENSDSLHAKQFLEQNASQMTNHGLVSLHSSLINNELAVLFRNNHFSTVYKNPDNNQLYLLVTDVSYLNHGEIVWETLDNFRSNEFMDIAIHLLQKSVLVNNLLF